MHVIAHRDHVDIVALGTQLDWFIGNIDDSSLFLVRCQDLDLVEAN